MVSLQTVSDVVAFLHDIQRLAIAQSSAMSHFADGLPEPQRSYLLSWAGTAENVADKAQAAEAAIEP